MRSLVAVKKFNVNQAITSRSLENVSVRVIHNEIQKYYDGCLDINECALKPGPCKLGERCDNTPGSYKCVQTFACANGLEMKELQCLGNRKPKPFVNSTF